MLHSRSHISAAGDRSDTAEPPVSSPWVQVIAAGLIASLSPLVLLLANSDWFFTREGFLDPWMYVGFFHRYWDPDYMPDDYKLARLPWILSGYAVTSLFSSPVTAAYVLHALFLCLTSLALFAGVYASFRKPGLAAVVAVLFGFYTHGHGSGGWDYHNTGAGALYLAAFAVLVLPSTIAGRPAPLMIAGALSASAVHTNVTLVNFLPALVFLYARAASIRRSARLRAPELLVRLGWGVLGALLVTVLLGLINWDVGRYFVFFRQMIATVMRYLGDPATEQAAYHLPWSSNWIWRTSYLALPGAVFLAGTVSVIAGWRRPQTPDDRFGSALVLQFLAMVVIWIAWQTAGQTALDVNYFAYVLIPNGFIALAGILARGWPNWCDRHWLLATAGAAACAAIGLTVRDIPGVQAASALFAPINFVAIGALFLLPLLAMIWRPSVAAVATLALVFAFANRLAGGSEDYLASDRCKVQPPVYAAIVDAASWLMETDPFYQKARVWFDENEVIYPLESCEVRLGYMANSITMMGAARYVTRAFPLPGIDGVPDEAIRELASSDGKLIIVSDATATVEAWSRRLQAMGLRHELVTSHTVRVMESRFTMRAWSVSTGS